MKHRVSNKSLLNEAPSELQSRIATLCGISLVGLTKRSAAALLDSALAEEVRGVIPSLPVTEAQRNIAKQLGLKGLSPFMELAALQIQAEFVRRNEEAIQKHKFVVGMWVKFIGGPHVNEHSHTVGDIFQISTARADGRIYFKGTNGSCAYASQLEPYLRSD